VTGYPRNSHEFCLEHTTVRQAFCRFSFRRSGSGILYFGVWIQNACMRDKSEREYTTDVLIVGAGPMGLALCVQLRSSLFCSNLAVKFLIGFREYSNGPDRLTTRAEETQP
jgi:hypothetical protein